jgi:hypothetical protein
MTLARTIAIALSVCLAPLLAQDCAPVTRLLPNGTLSGALDAASCQLGDGTPYSPYRLDLPVRGQIKFELSPNTGAFSISLRDASGAWVYSSIYIIDASGIRVADFYPLRPIEAGSYTLLVNGTTPGQTGSYTVNTTFTSEPGILCANFPNIGPGQTVAGQLPSSGCIAPDGTPYEAYTLTTNGAGTLTVTLASQDFTPLVALRSIDGHSLSAPAGGPMTIAVAGESQYLLIVSSADQTSGAYQIVTSFQPGPEETCRSQKSLDPADSDTNAITASSCFITVAESGDQSYYNYYDFTLPAAGLVTAAAVSGDFTPTLNLLDAAGNTLAHDSGGGGSDAQFNVQSSLRAPLPAGAYRLQVVSDVPSGGSYAFQYQFQAGAPQPCAAAPLQFGAPLSGALTAASCRTSIGLADLLTLTLPSAGTVDLTMDSAAFPAILAIRDNQDNLIVRNDAVGGLTTAHIAADLPAGVYTVVAGAASGAGSYQLNATFAAHDVPACTFAQPLDLNGGYIQRLGPRSCTGANGQAVDYYTFTLPADALTLAVMTSSQVDGYLTLYDAQGNPVRSDDDSYGYGDPLIVQYLPAGAYKLAARATSATAGGLYEVDLRTVPGPRPPLCTPKSTVNAGDTVTGVITYTACQYPGGVFADLYQLNLPADAPIDLRLNSAEFDAYLLLLDSKGAVIDEDDDSGGGTNARIARNLPAGAYTIVVEPFGDYTSHGAYTLITKTGG